MELRSSTHFHFVKAIKGSSVVKSVNMDSRGRPALKFKEIKEIYNLRGTINPNKVPRICRRENFESSPTKCYGVKVDSSDFSLLRGIKIKTEPEASDFSESHDGDERTDDLDDLSFGSMTLKQFQKKCKSKKRKSSDLVGLNKETTETCSSERHELPNFRQKDDEYDLDEPLISLKSKLSKNIESKRKSSRKSVSATSPNVMSLIKSEKFYHDENLLQPNQDSLSLVKIEVPEPGHSEGRTTIFGVTSVSDFCYSEQVDSVVTVSNDVPETTDALIFETEVPCPTKEPQHYSLNDMCNQYRGNMEPQFDVGVSSWAIVKVDNPEVVSCEWFDLSQYRNDDYMSCPLSYDVSSESMSPTKDYNGYSLIQVPETTIAFGLESGSTLYSVAEPLPSVSNAVSCEYIEDVIPELGATSSGWEIVKVDSPEIISYQCSNLQEFGQEPYAVYALPYYDISPESITPTKDCSPDLNDSLKSNSAENEMAWKSSSYDRTEVTEMHNDHSLQCLENSNEGSAHGCPLNNAVNCSSDNELPASIATDVDVSDKLMASPRHPSNHQSEQQQEQHPERLFSRRKAISPTSQERLRRAMDEDQHQVSECRGKLYFGKQSNHRILKAQGIEQLGRDGGDTLKPKALLRKAKQEKKGILKATNPSRSSVQRCSQSAIAFTERQMRDIESLATKLTTELKSMKDIVLGTLEASAARARIENADEVRIAVQSATKTEETARKWLSMMARDCNRFHKIMALTEDNNTAARERVVQKKRKISFADEAGGELCHIKVFKDERGTASLQQCDTQKQRL